LQELFDNKAVKDILHDLASRESGFYVPKKEFDLELYQRLLATLDKAEKSKDLNKADKEPILQLLFSLGYLAGTEKNDGRVLLEVPNGEMRLVFQQILTEGLGLSVFSFLPFLMGRQFLRIDNFLF
jgi:hypothetical protein